MAAATQASTARSYHDRAAPHILLVLLLPALVVAAITLAILAAAPTAAAFHVTVAVDSPVAYKYQMGVGTIQNVN